MLHFRFETAQSKHVLGEVDAEIDNVHGHPLSLGGTLRFATPSWQHLLTMPAGHPVSTQLRMGMSLSFITPYMEASLVAREFLKF
jgi:hypothetical protein